MATPATSLFRAWGLTIASEFDLAPYLEPAVATAVPDVVVVRGTASAEGESGGRRVRISWQGLAFEVRQGTRITVLDEGGAAREELAQFVAGPVMGALLTQRGFFVLHASAVCLDGDVVAFTARSGVGKSTLAAQLARCGAEHLADDMVVLAVDDTGAWVVIGPRLAKISDAVLPVEGDVVAREGLAGRSLVRLPSGGHVDGTRLRLGRLCVISDATSPEAVTLTRLRGARRLVAVAEADFGAPLVAQDAGAAALERTHRVARALVVDALSRPRRIDIGPAVARALRTAARPDVP
jgi:hypothetical protein